MTATSRKQQRRTQQQDLGRTQLLDAAEEVFGRRGFHDATLKEVAELAEFSVGSVYSFFENKDDLYRQVFGRRGQAFLVGLADTVATTTPARVRLVDVVAFEVGFFRSHPHFGRLYLRSSGIGSPLPEPGVGDESQRGLETAMELHASVFADGQREGTIRDGAPEALARILSGLVLAYLAADPAVVGDAGPAPVSLDALQQLVDDMFARRSP